MDDKREIDRREFLSASAIGVLAVLGGCSDAEQRGAGDQRSLVVETSHHERTVNSFEAEKGDEIEVVVVNQAGSRTHALINGPDGGIVLSEGVLDERTFTLTAEATGKYLVTMTPTDESSSTSGTVKVYLTKRSATDEPGEANNSEDNPTAVVREWVEGRSETIDEARSTFETGLESYDGGRYSEAESQYATARDQFGPLLDDAARNATDHPTDSELYQLFGSVSYYFSEMRDASRYYTFAAALRQRGAGAEHSAYGKNGDADFWEGEAESTYESAQEARESANDEISGLDL